MAVDPRSVRINSTAEPLPKKHGVAMTTAGINKSSLRIGIAVLVVLATIGYLAFTAQESNKSYYVTLAEMMGMGDKAYSANLRVDGFVKPESIVQAGTHVDFVLTEFESHNPKASANPRWIKVVYDGTEPPPDTFKGDAQALAIGTYGRDGVFHATQLQAKCASKYAPATPGAPGTAAPAAGEKTASASPAANTMASSQGGQ
jgi:cytochrome c-type biogenesis protein CcmE